MKLNLNLNIEQVKSWHKSYEDYCAEGGKADIHRDAFADLVILHAEVKRQGELIDKCNYALNNACGVFHKSAWEDKEIEAMESMQVVITLISDLKEMYEEIDSHVDGSSIVIAKDLLRSAFPEVLK